MNLSSILLWGFVATMALTSVQSASQALKLTRMSIPLMLGTIFTSGWERARFYGFGLHFINGWLFSVVYALIFEALGEATWWTGALFGVGHGLFILVVLVPLLPSVHPRMGTEARSPDARALLEPPGYLALNYGSRTPLVTMAAHVAYGLILGAFYSPLG